MVGTLIKTNFITNKVKITFYAYVIIGHTGADQLLPQLLMEQFYTLPIQCKHIEHMHEGVWFRKKIFLTK